MSPQKAFYLLQWLDCVHQLLLQFPVSFQFNLAFLVKIAQHTYTNLFGKIAQHTCTNLFGKIAQHTCTNMFSKIVQHTYTQCCGSGMIYSCFGFEFPEFRIQTKVPDPC